MKQNKGKQNKAKKATRNVNITSTKVPIEKKQNYNQMRNNIFNTNYALMLGNNI